MNSSTYHIHLHLNPSTSSGGNRASAVGLKKGARKPKNAAVNKNDKPTSTLSTAMQNRKRRSESSSKETGVKSPPTKRVKIETSSKKVTIKASPKKIKTETSSKKVTIKASPKKIKTETSSKKVTIKASPKKIKTETSSKKVTIKASPKKVKTETSSKKVRQAKTTAVKVKKVKEPKQQKTRRSTVSLQSNKGCLFSDLTDPEDNNHYYTSTQDSRDGLIYHEIQPHAQSQNIFSLPQERLTSQSKLEPQSKGKTIPQWEVTEELEWTDDQLLAQFEGLNRKIAFNLVKLFAEDNTIPFIARYRQEQTDHMDPEQLRHAKDSYEKVKQLRLKAVMLMKKIASTGDLDPALSQRIKRVRSFQELDTLSLSFKKDGGKTKAKRARELGLEPCALKILFGTEYVQLEKLVNRTIPGLKDVKEVQSGIQHIIADVISKDEDIASEIEKIKSARELTLESTLKEPNSENKSQFEDYREFKVPIIFVKPHQTLAINRGEEQNELSVKVNVPDYVWEKLKGRAKSKWLSRGYDYDLRRNLFQDSLDDSIKRLISPTLVRSVRANLNEAAQKNALISFAKNLKALLLTPPFRGKVIMAIDPGFSQGCKIAVISETGVVLHVENLKLLVEQKRDTGMADRLKSILLAFNCETIAVGNGAGGRETEKFLSDLIQKGWFLPLNVAYTFIDEQGASIYSASQIAMEEFEGMDIKLRSAVFLARRLQDPLRELVKLEPENLGVGMYQHDIDKKKLASTLNEVISECVSFVGVDVNTASKYLLRHVAGLGEKKATNIIHHRLASGRFHSREQIKNVTGIGNKTFLQCAGFLRIHPLTAGVEESRLNPLDRTWIHPESYKATADLLNYLGLNVRDLGTPRFIKKVEDTLTIANNVPFLDSLKTSEISVKFILKALTNPLDHDCRPIDRLPLFRKEITTVDNVTVGSTLTGVVRNVVNFGAFVDLGIKHDGLIHSSNLSGHEVEVNDKVEVMVMSKELRQGRYRIGLKLVSVLKGAA